MTHEEPADADLTPSFRTGRLSMLGPDDDTLTTVLTRLGRQVAHRPVPNTNRRVGAVAMDTDLSMDVSPIRSTRGHFLRSLRMALDGRQGFAAGKLGYSEQVWLASRHQGAALPEPKLQRATRASARFHACHQIGVFPEDEKYLDRCASAFAASMSELDFLAVHDSPLVKRIAGQSARGPRVLGFNDLEPNRSRPYDAADCYLPDLHDRHLLLITSPAELLAARATPEIFTAVWSSTGCPWFSPTSVTGLSFTSLFDPKVRESFASSLDVLSRVCEELAAIDFDVALIGAGSLGIPLAHHVKQLGRVGISLGGHLQVLFGVQGKRWREDSQWQQDYWNEAWIDMPSDVHPRGARWLADDGAYW